MKRAIETEMATTCAMTTVARLVGKGKGNSGKSDGNNNKGGGQATATRAMVTTMPAMWGMAMATRLAGGKEGKGEGGKVDGDGNEGGGGQRGQGWQCNGKDDTVGKWTAMATKRVMAIKTRAAGKEEGNGKGGKSNCNGKGDGNGKQQ